MKINNKIQLIKRLAQKVLFLAEDNLSAEKVKKAEVLS